MKLSSLKARLLVLTILLAGLPILFSGYFIARTAIQATVAEKQEKLFGAAKMLDLYLAGSYDDILVKYGAQDAGRDRQIQILNQELAAFTDEVAQAYAGIGVGYYHRGLDAIITYGPSNVYADKVGLPIATSHQGRQVMASGLPRIQEGDLVRGQIMNAMYPIVRDDQVIGYVWANELTANIEAQIKQIAWHIYWTMLGGLAVGIVGIALALSRLMDDIGRITRGLTKIKENLAYRITPPSGEIGEIATAINELAVSLGEKKRLEEQVQRADRLAVIGEMAAGFAHEIRNPLMAIKGFAELQGESVTQEERREYTDIIVNETNRMDTLIEQLLCFSRPATDLTSQLSINEAVKNTLVLAKMRASGMRISFEEELTPNLPPIAANEEELRQVLLNILINAIQAVGNIGRIKVATGCERECGLVIVAISDDGPGIAGDNLGRLFDPFYTTKIGGTGLGLAVAQHLMANWGASITVDSRLDEGSTFILRFPAVRSENNGTSA